MQMDTKRAEFVDKYGLRWKVTLFWYANVGTRDFGCAGMNHNRQTVRNVLKYALIWCRRKLSKEIDVRHVGINRHWCPSIRTPVPIVCFLLVTNFNAWQ